MLWLAGALFFALRYVSKKFSNKHKLFKLLPFAFLALAVAALAYAPLPFGWGSLGGIVAGIVAWVLGGVGGWFSVSGAAIAGVILFLIVLFGAIDLLWDMHPDGWAKWMVYTTPVLALVAAGPIASQVQEVINTLGGVGPEVVAAITG